VRKPISPLSSRPIRNGRDTFKYCDYSNNHQDDESISKNLLGCFRLTFFIHIYLNLPDCSPEERDAFAAEREASKGTMNESAMMLENGAIAVQTCASDQRRGRTGIEFMVSLRTC